MDELIRVDEELDDPVFDASDGELGVTTVSVTHDQSEAMASSDRVAVLSAGRLEPAGDPRTLYRRPETRFVSEFLGENDVFDADVVEGAWGRGPGDPLAADETGGLPVRVAGSDFRPSPVEVPSDGRLTFCARPADVEVDAGTDRLTAAAVDSEFPGETTRVHLEWAGRRVVVALEDPPDADELTVGFDPEDACVLG